jgi:ATP-binding cassette subfamily B protein
MTQHSDRLSKFFWHIIGPRQAWLWGLLATEFVGALVMNLVGPYFLKKIIDAAAAANEFRAGLRAMVDGPGLIYVSLFLVAAVNYRAMDWMRRALLPLVRQHIILDMFAYIKRHSSRMFADNFAGSLSNMIFDMANGAVSIFSRSVEMFGGAAVLVIGVVTMYMVHPLCALVFLLWAVTFIGSSLYYIRHIVSLSQNFSEHRTTLVGRVVDSLSNIGNIRLFARYSYEHAQLRHMADHNVALDRAMQLAVFKMRIAQDLSIVLFMGALLGILIHLYQGGMVSAGDFAMLLNVALGTF